MNKRNNVGFFFCLELLPNKVLFCFSPEKKRDNKKEILIVKLDLGAGGGVVGKVCKHSKFPSCHGALGISKAADF